MWIHGKGGACRKLDRHVLKGVGDSLNPVGWMGRAVQRRLSAVAQDSKVILVTENCPEAVARVSMLLGDRDMHRRF